MYVLDVQKLVIDLVKDVAQKYPADFEKLQTTLTPEEASRLSTCLVAAVNGH